MDVRERLGAVFRRVFDDETIVIRDDLTAPDVPGWDSLAHIGLIVEIEEEFNLHFTVDDIVDLKNVGEMIDLIARKVETAK